MKKIYKALLILCIPLTGFIIVNQVAVLLFLEYLMATNWIWGVAAIPILIVTAVILGERFDLWDRLKKAERIRAFTKTQDIPQEKRWLMGEEWVIKNFRLYANPANLLTMVDNFVTPSRDGSQKFELMLFTNKLINSSERPNILQIPERNRYPVCMDTFSGDRFSITSMIHMFPDEIVEWMKKHWFASIPAKAEAPLDRRIHEAVATGFGFEIAKQQLSTDKEEVKNENK